MITNFFIPELNNHDVQELWFQQDGATCHTARATIDLLKDTFGDRLISRFGPVNWPPRSCDLTPLDYFLWGYVQSLVYADKPQTLDHLEDNIRRVIADIRPQMLEKVIENWTSRLDYIRDSRSSHMPEVIFKIKFETDGTIKDIHKGRSGRPRSSTSEASSVVLDSFTRSPQKSTLQCARETGVISASVGSILQGAKWKVNIPQLVHIPNEDNPNRRTQFCEEYLAQAENDADFVSQVIWSLLLMGLPQECGVQEESVHTVEKLRCEIETASHAIAVATLTDVNNIVRHCAQKCWEVGGLQFENLL
ncbi:uncharacterized protein TNCV_3561171 [Trichonephila clavipes]|nr:uncharacterized protein TNCV_3561171 [Trichonephila clavipes]